MESKQPAVPQNVRVEFDDGTVIPLECVYRGRNPSCGCHSWRNPDPIFFSQEMLAQHPRLRIELLPEETEVELWYEVSK